MGISALDSTACFDHRGSHQTKAWFAFTHCFWFPYPSNSLRPCPIEQGKTTETCFVAAHCGWQGPMTIIALLSKVRPERKLKIYDIWRQHNLRSITKWWSVETLPDIVPISKMAYVSIFLASFNLGRLHFPVVPKGSFTINFRTDIFSRAGGGLQIFKKRSDISILVAFSSGHFHSRGGGKKTQKSKCPTDINYAMRKRCKDEVLIACIRQSLV